MALILLLIIYLAFISLGLPDSLLGAAWPVMQPDFGAPLETAGLLFMMIAGGTIVSSLASGKILGRFGTGKVTAVSGLMTASALLGFYFAPSLIWLIVFTVPLGLGAGAIDTGLNNYVASHYKAHHMSWLHCFWGVGATMSPVIMAAMISGESSWRNGYLVIAGIQFALVVILFFSLPLWNRLAATHSSSPEKNLEDSREDVSGKGTEQIKPLRIKGVNLALLSFLFYCGVESTLGLWGSSFLVNVKELPADVAARWVSLYYGGITVGRFVTGFITFRVSNHALIRTGQITALAGAILLFLPLPAVFSLAGFILIGLGLAPIFPCMLHETPRRFGKEHSQSIMGYQMAVAYTGSTFLPPLFGVLAAQSTTGILPYCLVIFGAIMLFSTERLNNIMKKKALVKRTGAGSTVF